MQVVLRTGWTVFVNRIEGRRKRNPVQRVASYFTFMTAVEPLTLFLPN